VKITEKTNFLMSVLTIVTFIITILGFTWYLSGRLTTNEAKTDNNCIRLDAVEKVDHDRELVILEIRMQFAKISTHLARIETDQKWLIKSMGGKE